MLPREVPMQVSMQDAGTVFLQPDYLDDDQDDVAPRVKAPTKARRFNPFKPKTKLARLYFIPKQVADTKVGGQRRKTGTAILSQLTCKSCHRVFHKRCGLRLHSCKKQSTMHHKPTQTRAIRNSSQRKSLTPNKFLRKMIGLELPSFKTPSTKRHKALQLKSPSKKLHDKPTLPISSTRLKRSLSFDFPHKEGEVKLRSLRSHTPAHPSNDSFSPSSGLKARLKRVEVKLQRCEVPSSFSAPMQPFTTQCAPSPCSSKKTILPSPPSSSKSCTRKPVKSKRSMAMVSFPAKAPCIEDMVETKKEDDEEVVILWQG